MMRLRCGHSGLGGEQPALGGLCQWVSLASYPASLALTCTALSAQPTTPAAVAGVFRREFVAIDTVRFVGVAVATVAYSVKCVGTGRVPLQIRKVIVRLIVVKVTSLQAFWAGADERLKDQPVDAKVPNSRLSAQTNPQVAAGVWIGPWLEDSSGSSSVARKRPHAPVV